MVHFVTTVRSIGGKVAIPRSTQQRLPLVRAALYHAPILHHLPTNSLSHQMFTAPPLKRPTPTGSTQWCLVMTMPCEVPAGRATRRGQHLKNVRTALETWCFKLRSRNYAHSLFTPAILLLNPTLMTLASNACIKTLNDMMTHLNPPWFLAMRHGQEVINLLAKLDADEKKSQEREKLERWEAKKQETIRL